MTGRAGPADHGRVPDPEKPDPEAPESEQTPSPPARPLDQIGALAVQRVQLAAGLAHLEIFTLEGLLTLLWHGDPHWERCALMGGGAMGGLLGPAEGLYHDLGVALAEREIGTLRVDYRKPNDLNACVLDMAAAGDLASRNGARAFVAVGHSFGGAVAVNLAGALKSAVRGVVTLSTQSAGCERAALIGDRPFLLLHGSNDELLPAQSSEVVRALAGCGELVVLEGAGHLLSEAGPELRERLGRWIPEVLEA